MIECDFTNLESSMKDFSKVGYLFPEEVNKFMQKEATNMQNAIKKSEPESYKTQQNPRAKNWMPFSKGRYKKFSERDGIKSWWILKNKVWYERLVEEGHKLIRGKRVVGYVHPRNFIKKATKGYEPTLFNHFENMVRGLIEKCSM